jgi:uncharacterized DUF497 family protein
MKIAGIIWLAEILEKLERKHSVYPTEVFEILNGNPLFRFVEKGHQIGENVYSALGQTDAGRYLIIFFVYKKNKQALILSARDMTKAERKQYEES